MSIEEFLAPVSTRILFVASVVLVISWLMMLVAYLSLRRQRQTTLAPPTTSDEPTTVPGSLPSSCASASTYPQYALQQAMQQAVDLADAQQPLPGNGLLVTYDKDGQSRVEPRVSVSGDQLYQGDMTVDLANSPQEREIKDRAKSYYARQGRVMKHVMSRDEMQTKIEELEKRYREMPSTSPPPPSPPC